MNLSVGKIIETLNKNPERFEEICFQVFQYQLENCAVLRDFVTATGRNPKPTSLEELTFLPISFFKSHTIYDASKPEPQVVYTSSATTGSTPSRHSVFQITDYQASFQLAFHQFFPEFAKAPILALLPNYLEREGSSLIEMVNTLIEASGCAESGFYLYNHSELVHHLEKLNNSKTPHLLIGVSFALTDLAENFQLSLPYTTIMETGGMKGRKKEMIREELHFYLQQNLNPKEVTSEYGMTELLSQAYLKNGLFQSPNWMRILTRDANDPFTLLPHGKSGTLNVIDLANLHSCSFIATDDVGKLHPEGFEVLGRRDLSDVRGCNLMVG